MGWIYWNFFVCHQVQARKGKHCGWYTFAQVFFLFTLDARFLGFEHIKELYKDDSDFSNVYNACET
jgi:hypothetical protein